MNEKFALGALGFTILLLVGVHVAEAQQPKKIARIGYLILAPSFTNPSRIDAFHQGLRQLGYVEGKILSSSTDLPMEKWIA
jgi:putative ABC transport system substrate-binding protein